MTTVRIRVTEPGPSGTVPAAGQHLEWKPTRRRTSAAGEVVVPNAFTVELDRDGTATVEVDPTDHTWCWRVIEVAGGQHIRHVTVPDTTDTVEYADLPDVDPATLDPVAEPEAAWWAEVERIQHLRVWDGGTADSRSTPMEAS